MKIKINNIPFESEKEITVLEAAGYIGIKIPSLCYLKNLEPHTSCMVCMVKDKHTGRFFPSCATKIQEGMDIDSESDEIMQLRKTSIELLLSDHTGDCSGPCESACRFNFDIPGFFNAIKMNRNQRALALLRKDLGLPFLVNQYCSGLCENACRRGRVDKAIKINSPIPPIPVNALYDISETGTVTYSMFRPAGKTMTLK